MTTYDDNRLAARFAALAPEPLAGNWDEVLDGAGARKDRRRLGHAGTFRQRRRLLPVVLALVAFVAVVSASAFAVRALTDKDIVGLPAVGATPSAPEHGVREIFYWVRGPRAHDYARSSNWVYADGRLIRLGARQANGTPLREAFNRWSMGFVEQRLTREGVKLLRSEIESAGGFGDTQPPAGSDPLGVSGAIIEVRKGHQLVHLRWASDLKRLEARLADLESWLPASAWKQRKVRAYVPSRFEVCAAAVESNDPDPGWHLQEMRPARIVTLLPAAAQNALRGRDWRTSRRGPSGRRGIWGGCFDVTTNEARSLAKALDTAAPAKKGRLHYTFNAPGPSRHVEIGFSPYLPHGKTTCLRCG
jgi:hypothetical protein